MMSKLTFCKIVRQLRKLNRFNCKLAETLGVSEIPGDDYVSMIAQALEEDTTAAWDDYLFEELWDESLPAEVVHSHIVKYLLDNNVDVDYRG